MLCKLTKCLEIDAVKFSVSWCRSLSGVIWQAGRNLILHIQNLIFLVYWCIDTDYSTDMLMMYRPLLSFSTQLLLPNHFNSSEALSVNKYDMITLSKSDSVNLHIIFFINLSTSLLNLYIWILKIGWANNPFDLALSRILKQQETHNTSQINGLH